MSGCRKNIQHDIGSGVSSLKTQDVFRTVFEAIAHPGRLYGVENPIEAPAPLNAASAAICLTWSNDETPVWTDMKPNSEAVNWLQFKCGCSIISESWLAELALVTRPASIPSLNQFKTANGDKSDSTTIIIQVDDFVDTKAGAGGKNDRLNVGRVYPVGLSRDFWQAWRSHPTAVGQELAVLFTCEDVFAALPKSIDLDGNTPSSADAAAS